MQRIICSVDKMIDSRWSVVLQVHSEAGKVALHNLPVVWRPRSLRVELSIFWMQFNTTEICQWIGTYHSKQMT